MKREGAESFSPAGLEYLFRLVQRASFQGKGFRHLGAAELCKLFSRAAAEDFGSFTEEALSGFGIATGAQLGRAVFLLASHGCLTLGAGESLEEYAAVGALKTD
jgi:uncharacterized repeat protein (TIGR04138 family)